MMIDRSENEPHANDLLVSVKTFERHQRNARIVKIFEEYFAELHKILLSPNDDNDGIDSAQVERERLIQFVSLTSFVMRHFDCDQALIGKLMLYVGALKDLETGRVHPILRPTFVASVPPESSERWRIRATLAVALEYLIRAKTPFDEAVRNVARARRINQILRTRAAAKSSVKSWRNDLKTGKVTSRIASEVWKQGLRQHEEVVRTSANEKEQRERLKEAAKLLIRRAEVEIALLVKTESW